ncbi:MAG: hypothetical protein LQ340_000641 [Diploschistes diacapsis]|nr:MAG: hypothetical protein LQ340_000641 [Diploschistes diacapsis]
MHTTRPDPDGTYPRTLDDSPLGPTSRAGASGLAPSPRGSGSSRSRAQYANHLSHRSDSSISSNLSERPSSFAGSSSSHASTNRSSPAIPPARTSAQLPERPLERRNLPPINTHGEASRPTDPRYAGSPTSARYPAQPGPGMPVQGYGSQYPGAPSYSGPSASAGYSLNFDNLSDYGDGNKKRRRGNLPKHVTDILRSWFQDHIAHPYPTEDEKVGLMQMTGLSMSQVCLVGKRAANYFVA